MDIIFLDRFSKISKKSDFMKIRPVGAELLHVNGQTDMTKIIVAFRNFVNVPKTVSMKNPILLLLLLLHILEQKYTYTNTSTYIPDNA
jgi:hypothetical protein